MASSMPQASWGVATPTSSPMRAVSTPVPTAVAAVMVTTTRG